jgi:hypothetical protein
MGKLILAFLMAATATHVAGQGTTSSPRPVKKTSISTGFGDTVLAQIADGGGWQTTITVVNLRATPTTYSITCYGDGGAPQAFSWAGVGVYSSLYGSLSGFESFEIPTSGTATGTTEGWCNVTSPGDGPNPSTEPNNDVGAFAVFSYAPTGQQVSVPATSWFLENSDNSLILAYDNTNGYSYGVALVDSNTITYRGEPNDTVNVLISDQSGNLLVQDSFQIAPSGHFSFVLAQRYPTVTNTRGNAIFQIVTSSGVPTLAGLGIRTAPWLAFTSIGLIEPATY